MCLVGCSPWGCKRIGHDVTTKQPQQQRCSWPLDFEQIPLSVSTDPTGAGRCQVQGGSKNCVLNRWRCPRDNYVEAESGSESHSVVSDSWPPRGLYSPWNSPGQNTAVGSFSLLQWIFPTQESNRGLLHCRRISLPTAVRAVPKRGALLGELNNFPSTKSQGSQHDGL